MAKSASLMLIAARTALRMSGWIPDTEPSSFLKPHRATLYILAANAKDSAPTSRALLAVR